MDNKILRLAHRQGISRDDIAKEIHRSREYVSHCCNGSGSFTISEAVQISRMLGLSDSQVLSIWFN